MSVEIRDRRFVGAVGDDVDYERVAGGFMFTEGPQWDSRGQRVGVKVAWSFRAKDCG